MSKENISKIYLIVEKIEYIDTIVVNEGGITLALNDVVTARPAILMHLTAIAEQMKLPDPRVRGIFINPNLVLLDKV